MATETVVSDHSSTSEDVEKEEVKKVGTECASDQPKGAVEAGKPDESSAEAEGKIEDSNGDEEPKTVASAPAEKVEVKAVAVEATPVEDESITKSTQEKVEEENKIKETPVVEALEHAEKEGEEEIIKPKELEEVEKVVDVPEPAEVIGKIEENVEEPPAAPIIAVAVAESKPEATEVKDVAVPEAESKLEATEVKDDVVYEAGSKPEKTSQPAPQHEATEEVTKESPVAQPVDEVEAKSCTDNADDTELPKKEETSPSESLDLVKSEAPVSQVEEENIIISGLTDEGTKPTKESVGVQLEEKAADPEKKEERTEVLEEKSVVAEELVRSEEKPTKDSYTSVPPESAEKVANNGATSRDIELVADNGIEKCVTEASPETTDEVKETATEVEKTEAAGKEEAAEAKLVEDKQIDEKIKEAFGATEPAETIVESSETIKGSEDTKTTQDVRKDVPVKTQKQSIVKIVKQSLVKAKKAIIGKSQNS